MADKVIKEEKKAAKIYHGISGDEHRERLYGDCFGD